MPELAASARSGKEHVTIDQQADDSHTPSRPVALHVGDISSAMPFPERRGAVAHRGAYRRVHRYLDISVALIVLIGVLIGTNAGNLPKGVAGFLAMRVTVKNVLLLATFALSWVGSFAAFGLYNPATHRRYSSVIARVVAACTLGSIAVLLFPLMTQGTGKLRYDAVLPFWVLAIVATAAVRLGFESTDRAVRRRVVKRIIIVGTGPRAMDLVRQLRADKYTNNDILGFVDTRDAVEFGAEKDWKLGFLDDLEQTLMHTAVDEVLIALPIKSCYSEIETAIRACEHAGVQSKYLADVFDPSFARPRMEVAGNFPLMAMRVVQDDYRLVVKRVLDLALVLIAIPVLVPLGIVIAGMVKFSSAGPVFFSHDRYGRHKRIFRIYKFRTMTADAELLQPQLEGRNEATGPVFKIKDDPRVTRLGVVTK